MFGRFQTDFQEYLEALAKLQRVGAERGGLRSQCDIQQHSTLNHAAHSGVLVRADTSHPGRSRLCLAFPRG